MAARARTEGAGHRRRRHDDRHVHRRRRRPVRRRQGTDHARGRVGRPHVLRGGRPAPVGHRRPRRASRAIASGVFSGTAMLNRLLTRKGLKVGAIVTAGQEDSLQMGRGIQSYLGYSYADRLHIVTHHHNAPLIPRERMHGVRGRIDMFGNEVLALREQDARDAANALLDDGRRGHRHHADLLLPQPGPRAAREGDRRGGEGQARFERQLPRLRLSELYPEPPRVSSPEHHRHRGLRRRAVAPHAGRCARPHQGARRRLRAARDGLARRHDLHRRRPAGHDAGLRARSAASWARAGWPRRSTCTTCCAPTSAARRSTSRC